MDISSNMATALAAAGAPDAVCRRSRMTAAEIAELFRTKGPAHLWVTDVFHVVHRRIAPEWCFKFWKTELKDGVIEEPAFVREQWPDGYAYLVMEWISPFPEPLLEVTRWD